MIEVIGKAIESIAKKSVESMSKIERVKNRFREITPKYLQSRIKDITIPGTKENPLKLPRCINRRLEGNTTDGVKFERKVFNIHGVYVEGVFPVFDGIKVTLSESMDVLYKKLGNTDSKFYRGCMKEATKALKAELEKYPVLKKQFTKQQLDDIYAEKGKITGKIWHHYEELGEGDRPIMQLVDEKQHSACKHTGGSYTWNEKKFKNKYGDEWENAKKQN